MNLPNIHINLNNHYKPLESVDLCANNDSSTMFSYLPKDLVKMIFDNCQFDIERAGILLHESSGTRKTCLHHSGKKDSFLNPNAHFKSAELILENDLKDLVKDFFSRGNNVEFWSNFTFTVDFTQLKFILQNKNILNFPTLIENLSSKITHIYLRRIDNLPPEIGNFKNLNLLHVDHGSLKNLPHSIGQLSKLEELRVSNNKLEKIPDEICNLKLLKYLYLNDNQLSELPERIGELSLQELTIENNKIKILPYSVRKLIDKKCRFDYPDSMHPNKHVLKLMPDLRSKIQYKIENNIVINEIFISLVVYGCFSIPFLTVYLLNRGYQYWNAE